MGLGGVLSQEFSSVEKKLFFFHYIVIFWTDVQNLEDVASVFSFHSPTEPYTYSCSSDSSNFWFQQVSKWILSSLNSTTTCSSLWAPISLQLLSLISGVLGNYNLLLLTFLRPLACFPISSTRWRLSLCRGGGAAAETAPLCVLWLKETLWMGLFFFPSSK